VLLLFLASDGATVCFAIRVVGRQLAVPLAVSVATKEMRPSVFFCNPGSEPAGVAVTTLFGHPKPSPCARRA
jgi:hypothetical protein